MLDHNRPPGKTTVSPEVLTSIARMAVLSVPGVSAWRRYPAVWIASSAAAWMMACGSPCMRTRSLPTFT